MIVGARRQRQARGHEFRWFQRMTRELSAVPVVDPELVILGGSIASNGDLLLEPVERELAALSPFRPRVEVSSLGGNAELTGALAMALETAQERLFDRGEGNVS